ncbi:KaiC domain-containing protein [Halobellus sp. EA9]|uniref:KaiC domain-containing protein n=1 Tax=Halobellus sp. EA9 TaxID=3421647 RepID=UPI003EBA379B
MSDDDDWFERALRDESETDGDADRADATEDADEAADSDVDADADDGGTEIVETDEPDAKAEAGPVSESGSEADTEEANTDTGTGTDSKTGESDVGGDGSDPGIESAADDQMDSAADEPPDENPFEEDFASALGDAPEPDVGSGPDRQDPFGDSGGAGGTGGTGGGDPEFGGLGGGDDFGDDFGGDFGGGDDFGFADFDDGPEGFDADAGEFESELERLDIGIDGLDNMILGGVPRRSLMVAIGSAGTGKTTFGLQFLNHGLEHGEDAVYITLEESHQRILDTAAEKGWEFERYVDEDRLAIVDIDPIEMANSLDSIQSDLPDLISEFGADRLVLDSVSLLEMMYESAPQRRSQVFGFTRALKNAGITTLMTSEASPENAYVSRFGIVEYLADAVFVLQYVRPSDFRETRLAVEIQKIRDANHSRETKPYELTGAGISVYRQANIF